MKYIKLKQLAYQWPEMTHTVLCLKEIPFESLQNLLKETYEALVVFHQDELVPKEISEIFLEMEDFLYFASLMEEKQVGSGYYCYRKVYTIVKTLEAGFLAGNFGCDFPKLRILNDNDTSFLIDFTTDILNDTTL